MNQVSAYNPRKRQNPACSDLMTMAERELAAFFSAVTDLFGAEQARLSVEDWLDELAAMNGLPASTRPLRWVTVQGSARLPIPRYRLMWAQSTPLVSQPTRL